MIWRVTLIASRRHSTIRISANAAHPSITTTTVDPKQVYLRLLQAKCRLFTWMESFTASNPSRSILRNDLVRPHYTSGSLPQQLPFSAQRILFRHPDYPDNDNIIFSLPPIDAGGIHHGTALTICLIFACNTPGYLTPSRDSPTRNRPFDEILTARSYYFYPHTKSESAPYPVCASFQDWHFPPSPSKVIPQEWYSAFVCISTVPLAPLLLT